MQKYNSISAFLDDLVSLVNNYSEDVDQPIQSSTSIKSSDLIRDLDYYDWLKISDIIEKGELAEDTHKCDEYIYDNLSELGYTSDEISEFVSFYLEH